MKHLLTRAGMEFVPNIFRTALHVTLFMLVLLFVLTLQTSPGQASIDTIVTQGASTNNNQGWSNPENAHGTADDNIVATAALSTGPLGGSDSATGDWGGYDFDTVLPTDAEIKQVEVIPQYHLDPNEGTNTLTATVVVNGSACSGAEDSSEPTTQSDFVVDVTSCRSWTRDDLLDANFESRITANHGGQLLGAEVTFHLDRVNVRVTYDTPEVEQSSYRVFENTDSTDVGNVLADQDTATTLPTEGMNFRVRMTGHVSDAPLPTSNAFKLQYIGKGSGTCATPSGGAPSSWTDVTSSTMIAYHDNPSVNDDVQLTANASDPAHSGHTQIDQSYQETNDVNTINQVADGEDGLWDFSLTDNNAPGQTTYCLRLAPTTGTTNVNYTQYAEITTFSELTVAIVDSSGTNVGNSNVEFDPVLFSFDCSSSNGTLGLNEERIRITNSTQNPQWNLNIAASNGSTALWSDGGSNNYDYNDPGGTPSGCEDGGDADSLAGQLSLEPSQAVISPESGCSSTGISLGSAAAFEEGIIDSITLTTTSSNTEKNCYWDFTGIESSQTIPPEQLDGTYDIEMTLTLTAT